MKQALQTLDDTGICPISTDAPINKGSAASSSVTVLFLAAADFLCLIGAMMLAYLIRTSLLPSLFSVYTNESISLLQRSGWVLLIVIFCLSFSGLYTRRVSFWNETLEVVKAVTLAFMISIAVIFLNKIGDDLSRTVVVLSYFLSLLILPLGRYVIKSIMIKLGLWNTPILIMGAGLTGELVARGIRKDPHLGYSVVGFLDDNKEKRTHGIIIDGVNYPVLGGFVDAVEIVKRLAVRDVVIAAPGLPGLELVALNNQLQQYTRSVTIVPDLFGIPVMHCETEYFFDHQILAFRTRNNLAYPMNRFLKRIFDLILANMIFLFMLPVMVLIVLAIKADSTGPAIYVSKRIGRQGKQFKCHKFRTMYLNNEKLLQEYLEENSDADAEWIKFSKIKGEDPRVTKVGSFLRKLSLDELPQIVDVIKGNMSLVGPRPYLPREYERMGKSSQSILVSSPGITGLWQVSGRNEIDFEGRLRLEEWYVHNWSLWLDISLLFRTIPVVLRREGAY